MPIVTREYLSWSQMLTWEKGPDAYYRQYILGERFTSKEMEFGKRIAEGLEKKETNDQAVEFCRLWLPKPEKKEYEARAQFESVPLLVKLDGWSEIGLVDEYKTGKVKWTQKRANEHGQLTIYDMVIWKLTGKIPNNRLFWIPTRNNERGEIELTGDIPQCFETKRTLKDFMLMYARASKAWTGINNFCKTL